MKIETIAIIWFVSILIVLIDVVTFVAKKGIHSSIVKSLFVRIVFAPGCALFILADWMVMLNGLIENHTKGRR